MYLVGATDQADSVVLVGQPSHFFVPESTSFLELMGIFYCTPVSKYWTSLLFRLIHLVLFGYALSLPGCGRIGEYRYWARRILTACMVWGSTTEC